MQMCAWRKLLDVGPSINSRNLVELHVTLTLVPAYSGVCFRAPPSSVVFLYGTRCFFVTPKLPGSENASSVLYMSNGMLSPGRFVIMWL